MSKEISTAAQAARRLVIENLDRPGHYWNPKTKKFESDLTGECRRYRTEQGLSRAYTKLFAAGVRIGVREWYPPMYGIEGKLLSVGAEPHVIERETVELPLTRADAMAVVDGLAKANELVKDKENQKRTWIIERLVKLMGETWPELKL